MKDDDWREFRSKHIDYLTSNEYDDAVTSATEYFSKFSGNSNPPEETVDALEEMTASPQGIDGLKGFCRVYPRENQQTMAVFANPRLVHDGLYESDNHKLSIEEDMRKREQISVRGCYLSRQGGTAKRAQKMIHYAVSRAQELEYIDIPLEPCEEDNHPKEIRDQAHDDIYYTNFYKFAAEDGDYIPEWASESGLAMNWIDTEIEAIEPETIFVFGSHAWNKGFRMVASPTAETRVPNGKSVQETTITEVQSQPFKYRDTNIDVLPFGHPTGSTTKYSDIKNFG